MNARTELLALLACVVPLDRARNMVDRHHAEVVGPLEAQRVAVLALHRRHNDSDHCFADDEMWPCQTRGVLDKALTDLPAAVEAMGALPVPGPVEDPHDSPLHHTYAEGRDLPTTDSYRSARLPAQDAPCATCGHNGAAHHHAGTACWADLPKRLGESIRICKCSAFEVTR
ncbi:hypothetical protein [Streptomyces sp. NPDC057429]|uniref:hypothetical protein n=1 Tax=Streptomyces sp. NPDC057429 TaxID=3346130 RepID=UPI0036BE1A29